MKNRIDVTENELDNYNDRFIYHRDERYFGYADNWRILSGDNMTGDCEDYSLGLLYIACDNSKWNMFKSLLTRESKIWLVWVKRPGLAPPVGHAVLEFKGGFIDNNYKRWVTREYMEEGHLGAAQDDYPYEFSCMHLYFPWIVGLKLGLTALTDATQKWLG